jgi:mono/diheme cytochrome c family protein
MALLSSIRRSLAQIIILCLILGVWGAGCSKTYHGDERASGDPAMKSPSAPKTTARDPGLLSAGAQEGKMLFESLGCMGCHTVNGQGGNVGPDLSNEGNSGRLDQWLATQIRHPRDNDPQTVMPAYDNLTGPQVTDLVDYLRSLKTKGAQGNSGATTAPTSTKSSPMALPPSIRSEAVGADLWGETCGECHNLRPPTEYSDAQWAVALHHMRVRAPLTGKQQRKILEFLQANN